jgi:ABC-2 type transport system permease protein
MRQLGLLLKQRMREGRNGWRALRAQSRLKLAVIGGFVALFEGGLFALFLAGFRFLTRFGSGALLLNSFFAVFFLGMSLLLALSAATAAYAALFRARDVTLLLSSPVPVSELVLFKWLETTRIASWTYLFIVLPFAGAYAVFEHGSALFVVWTALFSAPFLALCSAVGVLAALLLACLAPRRRIWRRVCGWSLGAAALLSLAPLLARPRQSMEPIVSLATVVPSLRLASQPLLPGHWVSEGIAALQAGQWSRGLCFWLLLAATAGVAGLLVEWLGGRLFFGAWTRSAPDGAGTGAARQLRYLAALLRPLPADARALLLKDGRLFVRDPQQWAQVAVFFGLLGIYFANIRNLHYDAYHEVARNLIAFLNAFSIAAVLGSLTSRFVFPQLSLEGHSLWLVGLAPSSVARVLRIKFLGALVPLLALTLPLMWLSTSMLQTPAATRLTILGLTGCVVTALTSLATGLGAVFLDLQNRNPAAIISGFGGTLNLVLSFLVVLLAIFPFGALFHLRTVGALGPERFAAWQAAAWAWVALLTFGATLLPLRAGAAALRQRDF